MALCKHANDVMAVITTTKNYVNNKHSIIQKCTLDKNIKI